MRRALLLALVLGWRPAAAEPLALRLPTGGGPEVSVAVGWPQQSVAVWLADGLGFGLDLRLPLASLGASLGTRLVVAQGPKGARFTLFAAGGVSRTFAQPGVGLNPSVSARATAVLGPTELGLGFSLPMAVWFGEEPHPVQARLPLLVEVTWGVQVQRVFVGLLGQLGGVLATDAGWSTWVGANGFLRVDLPEL